MQSPRHFDPDNWASNIPLHYKGGMNHMSQEMHHFPFRFQHPEFHHESSYGGEGPYRGGYAMHDNAQHSSESVVSHGSEGQGGEMSGGHGGGMMGGHGGEMSGGHDGEMSVSHDVMVGPGEGHLTHYDGHNADPQHIGQLGK